MTTQSTRWRQALEAKLGIPFTAGNELVPLRNGTEIFPAMLEEIERAQSSIDLLTFIYWTGEIAARFAEALRHAAERGVRTRVVLDSVGAAEMDEELVEELQRGGVEVRWFRPVRFLHLGKASHRTHRKVLICDGRVGFTGGVGIAKEWMGDATSPDSWRETHFRLRGPCVSGLIGAFLGNWLETEGSRAKVEDGANYEECPGESTVQVLRSMAAYGWSDVSTCFRSLLQSARERVRITTPYFVPDDPCLELLLDLPERGVTVELLVPGPHIDKRVARLGARYYFEDLLRAGVEIYRFQPTLLHAKVITVDGVLACIGSANFNHRSMRKDDEIILNVIDEKLVAELDADFDRDLEQSREFDLESWKERSLLQRALEGLTHPFHGEM